MVPCSPSVPLLINLAFFWQGSMLSNCVAYACSFILKNRVLSPSTCCLIFLIFVLLVSLLWDQKCLNPSCFNPNCCLLSNFSPSSKRLTWRCCQASSRKFVFQLFDVCFVSVFSITRVHSIRKNQFQLQLENMVGGREQGKKWGHTFMPVPKKTLFSLLLICNLRPYFPMSCHHLHLLLSVQYPFFL